MMAMGIKVLSHWAGEEEGILRDDGQLWSIEGETNKMNTYLNTDLNTDLKSETTLRAPWNNTENLRFKIYF